MWKLRPSDFPLQTGLILLFCVLPFFSGCSEEKGKKHPEAASAVKKSVFIPVNGRDLRFRIISKERIFRLRTGNPPVRFALSNIGQAAVSIPEWKEQEERNIELWYASPAEKKWSILFSGRAVSAGKEPAQEIYCELQLLPKNSVLADLSSSVLRRIGKPGKYLIRGKLALDSLPLETPPVEITITPE